MNSGFRNILLVFLLFFYFSTVVIAHEEDGITDLTAPATYLYLAGGIIVIVTVTVFLNKGFVDAYKRFFFFLIVIPVVFSTLYLAGHTMYDNIISVTKGPVHWHADYHVYVCGNKLDLVDPKFPSNKIGSPLFHEHDDDRIHIEGTVMDLDDVSLGEYFEVIGGKLEEGHLLYRSEDGVYEVFDGKDCDGVPSTLKVFVNGKRISDYSSYLIYPDPYVPPGDCIIVEFSPGVSESTDLICESWAVKGWDYSNFNRPPKSVGDVSWQ